MSLFEEILKANRATIIKQVSHSFGAGMGFTGIFLLAESHATIHTWPELGVAAVDVFTCSETTCPVKIINELTEALNGTARNWNVSARVIIASPRG